MLIEKVDAVCAKPAKHTINYELDVIRFAIEPGTSLSGLLIDIPTKLSCDDYVVAEWSYCLAENTFYFMWPVCFCSIEKGYAVVVRTANEINHFRPVWRARFILAARILNAHADRRDDEFSKLASL